jgi:hypothetical protein
MSAILGCFFTIVYFAVIALVIVSMWKVFAKAGKPGWAAIIPIYNWVVILEIIGKPVWWVILLFIPLVNIAIAILAFIELAKVFGKSPGFGVGMAFLPFVFFPILAFSDARYVGASSAMPPPAPGAPPIQ